MRRHTPAAALLAITVLSAAASAIVCAYADISPDHAVEICLASCGISCLAVFPIALALFEKKLLLPIRRLVKLSGRIAEGDFTARVSEIPGKSDAAELTRAFNRMAEELGSIEMLRKDFMSDFSHEFKTPLASIKGFADLIAGDKANGAEKAEYAAIISDEAFRLSNMAGRILMMSRLDAQNILPEREEFSLDEQMRECVLAYERQWEEKELSLDLRLSPVTYRGSRDLIRHVWTNLIENAIRYTPKGGKINISLWQDPLNVYADISDSGIGMTEDQLSRVFDKFYRADPARTSEGTGLGLPLAKRIVTLSGGMLTAQSVPGKGTLMSVRLPLS